MHHGEQQLGISQQITEKIEKYSKISSQAELPSAHLIFQSLARGVNTAEDRKGPEPAGDSPQLAGDAVSLLSPEDALSQECSEMELSSRMETGHGRVVL